MIATKEEGVLGIDQAKHHHATRGQWPRYQDGGLKWFADLTNDERVRLCGSADAQQIRGMGDLYAAGFIGDRSR